MKTVKLGKEETGKDFKLDIATLLKTRLLIQASSGGGKSYLLRKIIEQTHGHVQQIILDIEDDFSTLREEFDFVLVGKGGDISADPRSADLLARKVLELRADVIVNLYELKQHERVRFVKVFLDAMVNSPKELWHPCLVVLDEAHMFAPEKQSAESLGAVIDMESRGRKRGFCLVVATQRPAKLHKDVAAECQNKLIGLANQDIDRKRGAEELGFTDKAFTLSLRDLEVGEFYAVGPAFGRGVLKVKIDSVKTTHHEAGRVVKHSKPVATKRVKEILSKLADLPKEAEEELRDRDALQKRVRELEREARTRKTETVTKVEKIVDPKLVKKEAIKFKKGVLSEISRCIRGFEESLKNALHEFNVEDIKSDQQVTVIPRTLAAPKVPVSANDLQKWSSKIREAHDANDFGRCERAILKFLAVREGVSFTKTQVGVMTEYAPTSGSFNNSISKLRQAGLIMTAGSQVALTADAVERVKEILGDEYSRPEPDALLNWLNKLGKCEQAIFARVKRSDGGVGKNVIAEETGYAAGSGSFNNAISKLKTLGLISKIGDVIELNPELKGL